MPSSPVRDIKPITIVDQPPSGDNKGFTRADLNPGSSAVLDVAYARHKHFYRLNDLMHEQGDQMKEDVWEAKSRPGETLSYEQLFQGTVHGVVCS
jgi:hypothetical protein